MRSGRIGGWLMSVFDPLRTLEFRYSVRAVTDGQVGCLLVALAYGAFSVGGFVTRTMVVPPILRLERDGEPIEFGSPLPSTQRWW